jgi:hypothetical protein
MNKTLAQRQNHRVATLTASLAVIQLKLFHPLRQCPHHPAAPLERTSYLINFIKFCAEVLKVLKSYENVATTFPPTIFLFDAL